VLTVGKFQSLGKERDSGSGVLARLVTQPDGERRLTIPERHVWFLFVFAFAWNVDFRFPCLECSPNLQFCGTG
jgi:hypothetical protein